MANVHVSKQKTRVPKTVKKTEYRWKPVEVDRTELVTEEQVTITVDKRTARFLRTIVGVIGGQPHKGSPRAAADELWGKLNKAGVRPFQYGTLFKDGHDHLQVVDEWPDKDEDEGSKHDPFRVDSSGLKAAQKRKSYPIIKPYGV